eukprot:CAMPEP_0182546492 /NCGR_PEP_ID=MMETSP1323-20130603/36106_1 /TAXON_ID=236787 /ORGANISM="Florenciella parvula, Strain RCC1693" /LENGTH=150 /DNA_ID=CAMNT_0024757723 /DNA_START=14 /DNA_END=466 /DNA_ORIENTATION=+
MASNMALMLLCCMLALTNGFKLAPSSTRRAGVVRWAGEEPPPSAGTAWRKYKGVQQAPEVTEALSDAGVTSKYGEAAGGYKNQPYVDEVTGKTVVDVSDLGIELKDMNVPWDPKNVHPDNYDEGLDGNKFLNEDGSIDWNAMAKVAMEES